MPAREGWVETGGHRTWYRIVGDPEGGLDPLLCLHGGPGSTHNYFAPLERLAGEGRAVVLYDQVGCGRSDRPPGIEWGVGVFLDELAALREALGLDRVHLLGTSWGGMLALEHALAGGVLASLVLSSTLASAAEWVVEARRLRDELPPDAVAALEGPVDDPAYLAAEALFDARHFNRQAEPPPELVRMRAEVAKDVHRAMWGPNEWTATGALAGWDVRARLGELDLPALVLRGRYDICSPAIADTLVRGLRDARLVVLEHSSHTPVLEETERYLEVVGAFLREHDRTR